MSTLYTVIAMLGMGAIVGMYMLTLVLKDQRPPRIASVIHGIFVGIGIALLIWYSMGHEPGPSGSIAILLIAALVGIVLVYKDITGKVIPKWLAVLHGLTAVIGFTLLSIFAFM